MGTIEERAKQICVDTFCSMCPKRVYTTCIWRHNTERSQPKCGISEYRGLIKDAYHAAIVQLQEQHEELTSWRNPKEELPDDDRYVLVKTTLCGRYCIAFYKANGARNYHWHENNGALDDDMVIGWRPIHEL